MHEWMIDNDLTPHIVVDAKREGVQVPEAQTADGKIVLNVSHSATQGLVLGNDTIQFQARFAGVPHRIEFPVAAVLGIYARETGQGMIFGDEEPPAGPGSPSDQPPPPPSNPQPPAPGGDARRGKLKVVK